MFYRVFSFIIVRIDYCSCPTRLVRIDYDRSAGVRDWQATYRYVRRKNSITVCGLCAMGALWAVRVRSIGWVARDVYEEKSTTATVTEII